MNTISEFYKTSPESKVYWAVELDENNEMVFDVKLFSFDKKKVFNLYKDYPQKLSKEELEIFNKSEPYWCKQLA